MSTIVNTSPLRQREPRVRDPKYLNWLHRDLRCFACMVEGPSHVQTMGRFNPIEAAHQKLAIASKGWREGGGGVRVDDSRCVPLCTWHHRIAPHACDNGQRQFWDRLGLGDDVADLCRDLHAAYLAGEPGHVVLSDYARRVKR